MTESIHEAVMNWLRTCPHISGLCFNFGPFQDGATVVIPTDSLREEYAGGAQERRYAFELTRCLPASFDPDDPGNVAMQAEMENISAWIAEQDRLKNYPAFPDGCIVGGVLPLDVSASYVAAQDENLAKYMMPFAIDYLKGA